MRAAWQRTSLAILLAVAALPYFLGRTLPHDCHVERGAHHEHEDGAAVDAVCAICDLALPIADQCVGPMLLVEPLCWSEPWSASVRGPRLLPIGTETARGPPQG